jgi:CMP-N-acetylneuraminic acid synthetase
MIDEERVIAVIPARGGSKALPGKNIVLLDGKPLLAWSIDVARSVDLVDRVIVSTDDPAIAAVARDRGAEVYDRPSSLATDSALVVDALRHLISTLQAEGEPARIMVLLEPTCPFRSSEDVTRCIEELVRGYKDSVASFKEAELNPHRAWTISGDHPSPFIDGADPWLPRQQLPAAYQLNGAVYCFRADRLPQSGAGLLFGKAAAVIMPEERSVDINTANDLLFAEAVRKNRRTNHHA